MRKINRFVISVLILIIGVMSFTACGSTEQNQVAENKVFKIGTANGSLCLVPLHVAEDLGYFEEEFETAGISYELVEIDMNQAAELIAAGKIDACVGLSGSLIPQIDSGLEIAFTGGLHT